MSQISKSLGVDQMAPAAPAQPFASGSAGMGSASPKDVYPRAMSAPAAGSNAVRVSASGLNRCLDTNDPNGSPLTFSITRPSIRKPVLLYEYRDRGEKSSGRVAYSLII